MSTQTDNTMSARKSAEELAAILARRSTERIVFAESCTSGLVAALLGQVPGISDWLCGSAVTYRQTLKISWLGVTPNTIDRHTAESQETTNEMAIGVLKKTEEATCSAAVTGHLGPDAPSAVDGNLFVTIARRNVRRLEIVTATSLKLTSKHRIDRQYEAAKTVLDLLILQLS